MCSSDLDGSGRITVENMEDYASTVDIFNYWSYGNNMTYNSIELSNEASSQGGNHSIKMHYKGSESVSYARKTLFAKTVTARSVMLDIKGDGKATVYLNLNWRVSSSSLLRWSMRALSTRHSAKLMSRNVLSNWNKC